MRSLFLLIVRKLINLILKSQKAEIDKVYSALTARSKQVSTFSTKANEYFFELKENNYTHTD